jgi:hypothetical protein
MKLDARPETISESLAIVEHVTRATRDRCYDFKIIFANILAKKLAFLPQS